MSESESSKLDLTDRSIRARVPESERILLWDGEHPGLGLRLTAAGTGSWLVVYYLEGGRTQKRMVIGEWPGTNVKDAREEAAEVRRRAKVNNVDPLAERQKRRGEATVSEALDKWLADHVAKKRPATIEQ